MKFVLIPKSISWLSISLAAIVSFMLIGIGIPVGGGQEMVWFALSSLTLFGGITFLSIYEKIKGNEGKAAVCAIMNATLLLWWTPLAMLTWKAAQ